MTNLFKHAAIFTDLHLGKKNNSRRHNMDCEEFIEWFIDEAKARGCETCIFCGDWHDQRASIHVSTLNYSTSNMKKLNDAFENVYILVGNHDLFYRAKREINSFPYADLYENVHIINDEIVEKDGVAFVPWLIGDEWEQVKNLSSKYVFGHFELPQFMMNAIVEMPDHGGLSADDFQSAEYVFSGHFHKRQVKDKIHYIGSPFAHNYADVWDDDRGCVFLEWDGEPQYVNYPGPRYVKLNLSDLIDDTELYLNDKTYCKAVIDIDISYSEANFIKETFINQFNPRELSLIPDKKDNVETSKEVAASNLESVDQIVITELSSVDSEVISSQKLMSIYNSL